MPLSCVISSLINKSNFKTQFSFVNGYIVTSEHECMINESTEVQNARRVKNAVLVGYLISSGNHETDYHVQTLKKCSNTRQRIFNVLANHWGVH